MVEKKKKHMKMYLFILTLLHSERPKLYTILYLNPVALRKAKIVYNFGLSECNRVKAAKGKNNSIEITGNIS